jgi:hypothetical protein
MVDTVGFRFCWVVRDHLAAHSHFNLTKILPSRVLLEGGSEETLAADRDILEIYESR